MCASNSHSYTHLIQALGIVREPTVWGFITSQYPGIHDIGLSIHSVYTNARAQPCTLGARKDVEAAAELGYELVAVGELGGADHIVVAYVRRGAVAAVTIAYKALNNTE